MVGSAGDVLLSHIWVVCHGFYSPLGLRCENIIVIYVPLLPLTRSRQWMWIAKSRPDESHHERGVNLYLVGMYGGVGDVLSGRNRSWFGSTCVPELGTSTTTDERHEVQEKPRMWLLIRKQRWTFVREVSLSYPSPHDPGVKNLFSGARRSLSVARIPEISSLHDE